MPDALPLTVSCALPGAADPSAVSVSVEVSPASTGLGEKLALIPLGPVAASMIGPGDPNAVVATAIVAGAPTSSRKLDGESWSPKSSEPAELPLSTVTTAGDDVAELPFPSVTLATSVCCPFDPLVVSHSQLADALVATRVTAPSRRICSAATPFA